MPGSLDVPINPTFLQLEDCIKFSWEAPPSMSNQRLEYLVGMAVPSIKEGSKFFPVYQGPSKSCEINRELLERGFVETSLPRKEQCLSFRVIARNTRGEQTKIMHTECFTRKYLSVQSLKVGLFLL